MQPCLTLDLNLLDLIQAHFIITSVIRARRAHRLMAGQLLREFQRAIVN